ncbi:MAG: tetraacyldisaccharide 4'-kinase [Acidobacteria bacterium]|nr:tetraacyldisaccharide 4'-kinase [Acidobacteriota bacterium]
MSIGNIAMGGRGKTPTVAHVARLLVEAGERPSILSRGYARAQPQEGAVVVSDGRHLLADVARSGDEPLMLARELPGVAVVVCDVRAIAAALSADVLGATVHLLDDGFQHRAIARDADIVIVTPADLDGRRVPFGRLRSAVSSLARADAVVVDAAAADPVMARVRALAPSAALFALHRQIGAPAPLEPARADAFTAPGPIVALAGIAQPDRFMHMLRQAGWDVAETMAVGDHHRYDVRDLARLTRLVERAGAAGVLTTTKDLIRLLPLRPLPIPIAAVPLSVTIEPAEAFRAWLFARIASARA